jgi:MFS transporter, DHA1 family, multidrug resistance protein
MSSVYTNDTILPIHQKYLGNRGLFGLITLLSAFAPISTDLYLPALPGMAEFFNASITISNLTLILFIVFFSLGMLFWGPLSDKFGRRPVLLVGITLYIGASFACSLSSDIWFLIFFRIFQGIGGSAATAISTAMVKDVYSGRRMQSVLALVQSMMIIAPVVSPILGAFLLSFTSWRGLFWALTLIGMISMLGCLLLEETIPHRQTGTILQSFKRLGTVMRNPGFTSLLLIFSLTGLATLAFVGGSSYIYEQTFGLSQQWYSYYFALNATASITGALLFIGISRYITLKWIIYSTFLIIFISGVLICLFGTGSPLIFALLLLPSSLMSSCMRPGSTYLMLGQQTENTGSASSLINCLFMFCGSIGMVLISLLGENLVVNIGVINGTVGLVCFTGWLLILKLKLVKPV